MLRNMVHETAGGSSWPLVLNGPLAPGYRTVLAAFGAGKKALLTIRNRENAAEWETALYTVAADGSITRTAADVRDGSNGAGALVTFSAGIKDVICDADATLLLTAASGSGGSTATVTLADNVTVGDFVAALNSGSVERVKETIIPSSVGGVTTFRSGSVTSVAAAYDPVSGKVLIAYSDNTNNGYGTAVVGTVSGTSISFGSPIGFRGASTTWISVAVDTAGKFLIAYRDGGNADYGTAIVATIASGGVNFGTATVFRAGSTYGCSVTYDSANGRFVVGYIDNGGGGYGAAVVGTISGMSVTFGSPAFFRSQIISRVTAVHDASSGKIVVGYQDGSGGGGGIVIGTVSGTSISFGTPVGLPSSNLAQLTLVSVPSVGRVVAVFCNNANGGYGTAVVGTVSGTSISFGSPVIFSGGSSIGQSSACQDPLTGAICVCYRVGGSGQAMAVSGTVSGQTVSFSAPDLLVGGSPTDFSAAYDATAGRAVFPHVAGNLSGASVTYRPGSTTTNATSVIGVAAETKSAGQPCTIIPMGAVDTTASGLTAGQDYYITGAGARTTTAGDNTYVGRAVASGQMILRSIAKR